MSSVMGPGDSYASSGHWPPEPRGWRAGDIIRVWCRETHTFWNGKLLCASPDGDTLLVANLDVDLRLLSPWYGKGWAAVRGVTPEDVTLVQPGGQGRNKKRGKKR
jgi:hypothetical protein